MAKHLWFGMNVERGEIHNDLLDKEQWELHHQATVICNSRIFYRNALRAEGTFQ